MSTEMESIVEFSEEAAGNEPSSPSPNSNNTEKQPQQIFSVENGNDNNDMTVITRDPEPVEKSLDQLLDEEFGTDDEDKDESRNNNAEDNPEIINEDQNNREEHEIVESDLDLEDLDILSTGAPEEEDSSDSELEIIDKESDDESIDENEDLSRKNEEELGEESLADSDEDELDVEDPSAEIEDLDQVEDIEMAENEDEIENASVSVMEVEPDQEEKSESERVLHLPVSKVKRIMKTDNQLKLYSKDAVAAITIATELFISLVAQQSQKLAATSKKKTVQLNHVKAMLPANPIFDFLEGALPEHDI